MWGGFDRFSPAEVLQEPGRAARDTKSLGTVIVALDLLRLSPPRKRDTAMQLREQLRKAGIERFVRTYRSNCWFARDAFSNVVGRVVT